MKGLPRISQHAIRVPNTIFRRHVSSSAGFQVGDFAILAAGKSTPPIFAGPLKPGKSIESHKGSIKHDDIIGKRPRDVLRTKTNNGKEDTQYRLHDVKLEDYVQLSRRIVTPIYPQDANLIVSLLDLHPEPHDPSNDGHPARDISILEAGTGHGALTLYLSRAVHAANPPRPRSRNTSTEGSESELDAGRKRRKAVVYSIEASKRHSEHAEKTVRNFRQGQYYDNVDFEVMDVSRWVELQQEGRPEYQPSLTHAFLDLPDVQRHVAPVASIMKPDAPLIVFCPSITQITETTLKIRKEDTPLELERVIELGVNGGTGGRLWDVRLVKPRVVAKEGDAAEALTRDGNGDGEAVVGDVTADEPSKDDWHMVCRPKVGDRIAGGGFLAVFRKKRLGDELDIPPNERTES